MPSVSRVLLAALQATALVALVGTPFAAAPALASPLPLPLVTAYSQYARDVYVKTSTRLPRSESDTVAHEDLGHLVARSALPAISSGHTQVPRQDATSILDDINMMNSYSSGIHQNAQAISNIRNQMSSTSASPNANYRQQTVSAVTSFSSNLKSWAGLLAWLAQDKGLANYDSSNQVETMMKNTVNDVKYSLNDLSEMINNDPTLGPLIGPLVYDIKCIIDETLDAVENMTDGILNDMQPLLQALDGQATDVTCESGIEMLGLCLVLR
ncbi:hypothetical protein CERSUDRAFT_120889 [Gelatoporia subvermispora B]|uniref:Secreted protein n=1 Tax=Ceriporiopsis subvermispora (strain B) TaxID=914234 RepID=M2PYR6_CERS8|nr:hypothetical protein CERSUDRAFT_120889 [Gelatoporia subvermispora B]